MTSAARLLIMQDRTQDVLELPPCDCDLDDETKAHDERQAAALPRWWVWRCSVCGGRVEAAKDKGADEHD